MPRNIPSLITALRNTAHVLEQSQEYQWGHMGCCNCGYLARQITHLRKDQIHTYAMQRCGDWTEQLNDYCPTSGLPMDALISEMIAFGFDADDLKHLERLSNPEILHTLPSDQRNLRFNSKMDVIKYMSVWANVLEENYLDEVTLPDLTVIEAEA